MKQHWPRAIFVQGPPAIIGVELSEELNNKLAGFVQEGAVKGDFGGIVGQDKYQTADQGSSIEALNSFLKGGSDGEGILRKLLANRREERSGKHR